MRKLFILILVITLFIIILPQDTGYIIPSEAIRLRIIANSNSVYDQLIKEKVKLTAEEELLKTANKSRTLEESRKSIIDSLPLINKKVDKILLENNYNQGFNIKYGYNFFPKKEYKGVTYSEGNYESLVITLGEGKGDNWWCVLFPPICFIDEEHSEKIEYKFLVKDIFESYFNK